MWRHSPSGEVTLFVASERVALGPGMGGGEDATRRDRPSVAAGIRPDGQSRRCAAPRPQGVAAHGSDYRAGPYSSLAELVAGWLPGDGCRSPTDAYSAALSIRLSAAPQPCASAPCCACLAFLQAGWTSRHVVGGADQAVVRAAIRILATLFAVVDAGIVLSACTQVREHSEGVGHLPIDVSAALCKG